MVDLTTVQKVARSGVHAYIIVIPKKVVDILDIDHGDYIEIMWKQVIKKSRRQMREQRHKKDGEDLPRI